MGTKSKARCPICSRILKYLYENEYEVAESKAGNKMIKWKPVKRALFCKICKIVYTLELEKKYTEMDKLQTDMKKAISKSTQI